MGDSTSLPMSVSFHFLVSTSLAFSDFKSSGNFDEKISNDFRPRKTSNMPSSHYLVKVRSSGICLAIDIKMLYR